jgi:hypothetical protein
VRTAAAVHYEQTVRVSCQGGRVETPALSRVLSPCFNLAANPPRQGLALVPISAQLELFRPPYNPA